MNGGEPLASGLYHKAARLSVRCPKGSSQFTAYCTGRFFFFYAKYMHRINLSAKFIVEIMETELFTAF